MRHGVKKAKLQRKASHRKALLANQACSLIFHGRITTTLAKAKALRPYVEKLITLGKSDATRHNGWKKKKIKCKHIYNIQ